MASVFLDEEDKTLPPRGMRDYFGKEKLFRDELIEKLKKVFELYGFSPLETPALEKWSVLSSKYAGGEEILKETYSLEDLGKRRLGLRYDLTVPLARFFAGNPRLGKPFRRYQIASVWRDGPVSSTRLREFLQCDADIVGVEGSIADAEVISLASTFFKEVGLNAVILINNRKVLDSILDFVGVKEECREKVFLTIDKMKKLSEKELIQELERAGVDKQRASKVFSLFRIDGDIDFLEKELGECRGLIELKEVIEYCNDFGVENAVIDFSLARGLSYYTGNIFEVVLKDSCVKDSVAGGGRYDRLIGDILKSKEKIPAVGISFGLDRIMEALNGFEKKSFSKTRVFVIPVNTLRQSLSIVQAFRNAGVNSGIDLIGRSLSRNLEYASKQEIPFSVIVGEREVKENKVRLRNMVSGEESVLSITDAIAIVK